MNTQYAKPLLQQGRVGHRNIKNIEQPAWVVQTPWSVPVRSMPHHVGMAVESASSGLLSFWGALCGLLATGLRTLSTDTGVYFCSFLPLSTWFPAEWGPDRQSARSLFSSPSSAELSAMFPLHSNAPRSLDFGSGHFWVHN